ncbi:hypothetical protein, partial [Comamonas thiooxydans]|uniref:hypothetical protein n=1 Tax=Comamonas thiooxydans TaxID=363952 RepID=UPI003BF8CDB1
MTELLVRLKAPPWLPRHLLLPDHLLSHVYPRLMRWPQKCWSAALTKIGWPATQQSANAT